MSALDELFLPSPNLAVRKLVKLKFVLRVRRHGGQMAEQLGSRAINQKVVGSIPGRAKWRCVLGQGTSPYLPWGNVPVLTVSRSG